MADYAFMTEFRDSYVAGFERRQSDLKLVVNSDVQTKGNQAVWDIVNSSGTAVTRGLNGRIPAGTPDENQISIVLQEWHAVDEKTSFNIWASQGDGRRKMAESVAAKMNRKIDDDILGALSVAPNAGSGGPVTLAMLENNIERLGLQDVPVTDPTQLIMVASLSMRKELYQIPTFTSHDYNEIKPLAGPVRKLLVWGGVTWVFSNALQGRSTTTEQAFLFHRDAFGHAVNAAEIQTDADYDRRHDFSWARATQYMGSKILQPKGVLKITHDGTPPA